MHYSLTVTVPLTSYLRQELLVSLLYDLFRLKNTDRWVLKSSVESERNVGRAPVTFDVLPSHQERVAKKYPSNPCNILFRPSFCFSRDVMVTQQKSGDCSLIVRGGQ